jgi:hypothetical protein
LACAEEDRDNKVPTPYYGDSKRECRCSPWQIENYRQKISGPLLDRIDLLLQIPAAVTVNTPGRNFERTNFIGWWASTPAILEPFKHNVGKALTRMNQVSEVGTAEFTNHEDDRVLSDANKGLP